MIVETADRDIVEWAAQRSVPYYYTRERELPDPCLKVHCGHVTAYFTKGRLTRVWAQADHCCLDELFAELTDLFCLCTRIGASDGDDTALLGSPARLSWGPEPG